MEIKVNSNNIKTQDNITVQKLLIELNVLDKTMAVAINMNVVKKDQWLFKVIKENDEIEILNFVGGG